MPNNKKYVELLWEEKYDRYDKGEKNTHYKKYAREDGKDLHWRMFVDYY